VTGEYRVLLPDGRTQIVRSVENDVTTPGVNFTNILLEALHAQIPKAQKDADDLTTFLLFWDM